MSQYVKKAKNILEKNKHYGFFRTHIHDFSAINDYKGLEHLDLYFNKNIYERSNEIHFNLSYSCWFVVVCTICNYGDDWCEFENDRDGFIYDYKQIQIQQLSKVFCELKEFFLAYKVLCKDTKDNSMLWYKNVPKNLEF